MGPVESYCRIIWKAAGGEFVYKGDYVYDVVTAFEVVAREQLKSPSVQFIIECLAAVAT